MCQNTFFFVGIRGRQNVFPIAGYPSLVGVIKFYFFYKEREVTDDGIMFIRVTLGIHVGCHSRLWEMMMGVVFGFIRSASRMEEQIFVSRCVLRASFAERLKPLTTCVGGGK